MLPNEMTDGQPLIVVAGLDGPIVRGSKTKKERFYHELTRMSDTVLVYVTDRYEESARAFQEIMHLPRPDIFVTDMGASVSPGQRDRAISLIDQELDRNWPGSEEVLSRLAALDHLIEQYPFVARRRVSFLTRDGVTTNDVLHEVEELLTGLDVQVIEQNSAQFDVIPAGVTLKRTLDRVVSWIDANRRWRRVVIVGSQDDMRLVDEYATAIAVAEHGDDEWPDALAERQNVHVAPSGGCNGIHEAMITLRLTDPSWV